MNKHAPFPLALLIICLLGSLAIAAYLAWPDQTPKTAPSNIEIVATIKPIHSLVEAILGETGHATLLISGGASPHTFSLKPSHATALARADLVVWVGPDLERFLAASLENVAAEAKHLAVGEVDGLAIYPARAGGAWTHQHRNDEHEEDEAESDHGEGTHVEETHDESEHLTNDPHIWLDPQNAIIMATVIEKALMEIYPDHTETFTRNATGLRTDLELLDAELKLQTAPVKDRPFFVFHDAYQYFERRYDLSPLGAITATPDLSPGARRIQDLRNTGDANAHICVFAEPQFEPRTMRLLTEGRNATLAYLDPLGSQIEEGPGQYSAMLRALTDSLVTCLSKSTPD
ncbi:MAG: zinc ABC transporter substrate-binding protein [Parvibaculum sp.]